MTTSELYERIRFRGQPVAHPGAVVVCGNARFTVLTPRLLRLEWSESGEFEDRCTFAFPTRYSAVPPAFETHDADGVLTINTGELFLRYKHQAVIHQLSSISSPPSTLNLQPSTFNPNNLSITLALNSETVTWAPGTPNSHNLRGTRRTLDNCDGDAKLDEGLLSRAGWALFDDSKNVIFDDTGWVGPRPDWEVQDWYFFGYGHDYKSAIADYVRFGGEAPLIPRFILGGWWSRYWAYSEQDFRALVAEFEAHNVPLDVFVIDMDWHTPDGWTGYTWNRDLFPDPPAFLKWLHDKGLRVTLNLHPADGVHSHEVVYPEFARAMGIDPSSKEPVPFRIADKNYVKHYFEMLHHPMEDAAGDDAAGDDAAGDGGVDFWWMDWQQGEISEVKGLDPLPWINHLHFNDIKRRGKRPMLYSRWGGLGNQRYYIGFSGDTYVSWASLQFQPHLTATASNVAYGWWSHDIGGHMGGPTAPELYARWVQFGALSPILRLHATKDPRAERRPWAYPEPYAEAAMTAFRWRYRLVPYLYTMARVASDTGIPLCRPMYYEHPEADDAYVARYQYYFGDQMIAAPIVFPADPETGLAHTDVWVPEGTWIAYDTLEIYTGPRWVRLFGDIHRMPLLMKSGAILPLAPAFEPTQASDIRLTSGTTEAQLKDQLELLVFPGEGAFRLYEDDGVTEAYREGQFEWTAITTEQTDERTWAVTIVPVEGHCDAPQSAAPPLPAARGYTLHLRGSARPSKVLVDGEETAAWQYDPRALETTVHVPKRARTRGVTVKAIAVDGIVSLGAVHNARMAQIDLARLSGRVSNVSLAAVDNACAMARRGGPFAGFIEYTIPYEAAQHMGRVIVGAPVGEETYDIIARFTLYRAGETETHTVNIEGTAESHVIATPFAFDGQVGTTYWEADVTLTWRGVSWTVTHKSQPYFPTLHVLKAVVFDSEAQPLTVSDVVDEAGCFNPDLAWEDYSQQPDAMVNLTQRHIVRFARHDYAARLRAGEVLAAYMAAAVLSPDERDAVLLFGASDPIAFTVNGRPVSVFEREEDPDVPAYFRAPRQTAPVRLRKGENTLLIHTESANRDVWHWFFAGGFATVDGELMMDLAYKA